MSNIESDVREGKFVVLRTSRGELKLVKCRIVQLKYNTTSGKKLLDAIDYNDLRFHLSGKGFLKPNKLIQTKHFKESELKELRKDLLREII